MAEASTLVFDASNKVLGRLASHVASELLTARKAGNQKRVIIVNAEKAIVTGPKTAVFAKYDHKYKLNHPRSTGRNAVRDLRVMIGTPANLSGDDLPDGHAWGDSSSFDRDLPQKFVRLGQISEHLGIDSTRWGGEQ